MVFFLFMFYLLNEFPPTLFFSLNVYLSYSVFHSCGFLGVSFTILSFLLGPTFPTTCMQPPVLPYQERVHSQLSSRREQGRLAPMPQWKQVKKLILTTMHPTLAVTVVFLSQSFPSSLSESVILNNFQWIKSASPFGDDAWFNVSKIFNQIFPALLG